MLTVCLAFSFTSVFSQQLPTGPAISNAAGTALKADHAWLRGGNIYGGGIYAKNIFGFSGGNSPIYTETNGSYRTKHNGMFIGAAQYPINGFNGFTGVNCTGYFLLGQNSPLVGPGFLYNNKGAFSLLHLNGDSTKVAQEFGYRTWMKTGITFTDNNDRSYVGYRVNALDVSDFVLNWSDNSIGPFPGPDNLIFNFTSGTGSAGNDIDGNHPNGREVARMTGYGYMGIGPRFDNTMVPPNAVTKGQPQSDLHINKNDNWAAWVQVSIQKNGQRNIDGLRMGLVGAIQNPANPLFLLNNFAATPSAVGTAMIYNQENRPLLFSTGQNNTTFAFNGINSTMERVRIMAVGDSTQMDAFSSVYQVNNPGSLATRLTRMSISHDPVTPVTRPLSLLHLGYNTGAIGGGTVDGWRSWMDIGMFTSNGTDNVYIGLKREPSSIFNPADRHDAVINWGDNQQDSTFLNNGSDHLRFIFTGTQTGSGVFPPANSQDGLECGRFYPDRDTLGTYGRFGVGDFTASGVNEEPTHKIDVVGNGRFRFLPDSIYMADSLVTKFVMVDSAGVLRWLGADQFSFQIGQACGDSLNLAQLTVDREVPMNDFNIYFTGQGVPTTNSIALGLPCGTPLPAKFNVYQDDSTTVTVNTIAGGFQNSDTASTQSLQTFRAVIGITNGVQPIGSFSNITNIGADFAGRNAVNNIGVRGRANAMLQYDKLAIGGDFLADGPSGSNFGTRSIASGSNGENYGIRTSAFNTSPSTSTNYGGRFNATGGTLNFGIYAEVATIDVIPGSLPPTSGSFAGYFNGSVLRTGNDNFSSDASLKTNIDTIENASEILVKLKPKTFYYDTLNPHGMMFSSNRQFGFIAQDVDSILPELVGTATHPATFDTLGNITIPAYTYLTLQYQPFIALLTKGFQEQKLEVDSLKEVINQLNERLNAQDSINNAMYAMITQCCQNNNSNQGMMQNNGTNGYNPSVTNVELSDVQSIILDQNVPNPFAEQTTITFTLTEGVQKAQMLFYNLEGKLIKAEDISNKAGKGQVNVFANDLTNGIYSYTLVVDGKIIDTKRMVKQK